MYAETIFELPLSTKGNKPFVDVGSYIWMNVSIELCDANLVDKAVNLSFQLVCKEYA